MTTYANEMRAAALNGMTAVFNNGFFRLLATATELAKMTFGATAFGAATVASPSVASANAITPDTSVTAGTINAFELQTSGSAVRISGSVGLSGADIILADVVVPPGATSVSCSALQLSLQIT